MARPTQREVDDLNRRLFDQAAKIAERDRTIEGWVKKHAEDVKSVGEALMNARVEHAERERTFEREIARLKDVIVGQAAKAVGR